MTARRKRNKKWLSTVIILLLLIAAGVVCFLVWNSYFKEKEPEAVDEETTSKEEPAEEKKEEEKKEEPVEKEEVVQYEGDNPNAAEALTGVITYMSVSGSDFVIRVNIDQYLDGGICALTISRDGATIYNSEANIIDTVSTSTCEGFNVPVSSIGSGNIRVSISFTSGGRTGTVSGETSL